MHKYQDITSAVGVGGVGLYIKCTIKYKERQDLSKLDGAIEHMWAECQGTNKK